MLVEDVVVVVAVTVEETLTGRAEYAFSLFDPPQYSEELPLQIILHPF